MASKNSQSALRARSVGDIAATLPGATAIFRKFKIDFCCNGDLTLDDASRHHDLDPGEVAQALEALNSNSGAGVTPSTLSSVELIDHIQSQYYTDYRRVLPELITLSRKVEAVHRGNPHAPAGLADLLQQMENELQRHIAKEETALFPAMRQTANGTLNTDIAELRHDHDGQGALLRKLDDITDSFTLPEGACRSWQALYAGTSRLAETLVEHIHLENNVLFPRFSTAQSRA